MSKTQHVEYRGRTFWAYDVALGVFLKYLIDAAEPLIPAARSSSWKPGSHRLHSDDPAFAEFTGGTDPIPLYDVQAA